MQTTSPLYAPTGEPTVAGYATDAAEQAPGRLHIQLGCVFQYRTAPGTEFVLLVAPPPHSAQAKQLQANRDLQPAMPCRQFSDEFGNHCWRFTAKSAALTVRYEAVFAVSELPDEVPIGAGQTAACHLPDEVLQFTRPSRLCPSDLLSEAAWDLFGTVPAGYARVQAICDWVHANVEYRSGVSDATSSALDTFTSRQGVCRDFAHLPMAFCRALTIPARYAFGYLPDYAVEPSSVPMDFHAWFEVFLGGRWYAFDARHNVPRIGRVKVGHGRDAVDVAMVTSYGPANLDSMTVWAQAEPVVSAR